MLSVSACVVVGTASFLACFIPSIICDFCRVFIVVSWVWYRGDGGVIETTPGLVGMGVWSCS